VRVGHGRNGHQLEDGRFFDRGPYEYSISFQDYREEFIASVYFRLQYLFEQVAQIAIPDTPERRTAMAIHRNEVLPRFYALQEGETRLAITTGTYCVSFFFQTTRTILHLL
jgi:hypothetical protein